MSGKLLAIFFSALLINNFTLSYFLGLCPFFGVSGRLQTAFRLGVANTFVLIITSLATWALNTYVLVHAPYLALIAYILVIASTVQFVEMVIKKTLPAAAMVVRCLRRTIAAAWTCTPPTLLAMAVMSAC